jgi:hypothetical protein
MCWSSEFDLIEGATLRSTLRSESVPGGRTDRSREPSRARAVRRLGVPVGMGGKANCLCLRGIWETPKPRYREETKPVVRSCLGPLFVPKIPLATPGRGGVMPRHGDRGAEGRARRLTCAERHGRVSRGVSAPRCVSVSFAAVRVRGTRWSRDRVRSRDETLGFVIGVARSSGAFALVGGHR